MSAFVPCTHCQRHVRMDEAICPFCAGSLPLSIVPSANRVAGRLGRAAKFAFGAAVAASTTIACGDDSGPGPGVDSGRADSGSASMDAGGSSMDSGTSTDGGGADSATTMDSGTEMVDSGTSMQDAGFDAGDEGMVMPLYGAPPMRD
jgi:hypothetical protein